MKAKFPILKNFKIFGIISILLCATGLVGLLALPFGQNLFNLDIDFAGGTEMEFNMHQTVTQDIQNEVTALFKEATGKTVTEFIRQVRLTTAARLLLVSNDPVNCIAHDVGFEDANHFTRVFRQAFGMTPNQYRKMSQE